jgi:hypothetical protein
VPSALCLQSSSTPLTQILGWTKQFEANPGVIETIVTGMGGLTETDIVADLGSKYIRLAFPVSAPGTKTGLD